MNAGICLNCRKEVREMYLDEDIKLDFKMPAMLKTLVDEIDLAYRQQQEIDFLLKLEMVEATAKQCNINHTISASELHQIFCRYGLR